MFADGVGITTIINGFTVIGGNANGGATRGRGGGLSCVDSEIIIVRCVFQENSAGSATNAGAGGGLRITDSDQVFVINCSFIDNRINGPASSTSGGGGFRTSVSTVDVTNCLFRGNTTTQSAANGGAGMLVCHDGIVTLINCTFVENGSAATGGGIWIGSSPNNNVTITNCVFWGNTDAASADVEEEQIEVGSGATFVVTYTCIEGLIPAGQYDTITNSDNIPDDPEFVDETNGDFRLIAALSPCVDTADTDAIPPDTGDVNDDGDVFQDTPFDLALDSRLVDGDEDSFDDVDMGAYESVPCLWDLDGTCVVSVNDLLILLADWGDPYGIVDLLALLADWGPCYCGLTIPLTLQEELDDACLSMANWDEFVDVMGDPESSQEDKDRYNCWMTHYLDDCPKCFCAGPSGCPDPDPFF